MDCAPTWVRPATNGRHSYAVTRSRPYPRQLQTRAVRGLMRSRLIGWLAGRRSVKGNAGRERTQGRPVITDDLAGG